MRYIKQVNKTNEVNTHDNNENERVLNTHSPTVRGNWWKYPFCQTELVKGAGQWQWSQHLYKKITSCDKSNMDQFFQCSFTPVVPIHCSGDQKCYPNKLTLQGTTSFFWPSKFRKIHYSNQRIGIYNYPDHNNNPDHSKDIYTNSDLHLPWP